MFDVHAKLDTLSPTSLFLGGVLAVQSVFLALLATVVGQGLGGVLGGCRWIGISIPIHRQAWALVNQPNLAFASESAAVGYWLGSLVLPLVASAVLLLAFPKLKSLNAELLLTHTSWAFAAVAGAWMPLLDAHDGHLARWLHFVELPPQLVWLAPAVATGLASLAALRLLAMTRIVRRHSGRATRLTAVVLHFVLPWVLFVGIACLMLGEIPIAAVLGAASPVLGVLLLAWTRYPPIPVHSPRELRHSDTLRALAIVAVLGVLFWTAGRPLPESRCAGVVWSSPLSTNNVRAWIEARSLLWWMETANGSSPDKGRS